MERKLSHSGSGNRKYVDDLAGNGCHLLAKERTLKCMNGSMVALEKLELKFLV